MQVNNRNCTSPNFGMALKIHPKAQSILEEVSMETVDAIQKAGKELKDTTHFHLRIDENGVPKIESGKDAYFGLFKHGDYSASEHGEHTINGKTETDDRIILINRDKNKIAGVARYLSPYETQPRYNAWGAVGAYKELRPYDIGRLSELVKLLDDVAVEKYAQQIAEEATTTTAKGNVRKGVAELLDLYSAE